MFDSGSMTWKEKMRMHESRAYVALAVHEYGNRIYAAGGENAQKEYVYTMAAPEILLWVGGYFKKTTQTSCDIRAFCGENVREFGESYSSKSPYLEPPLGII